MPGLSLVAGEWGCHKLLIEVASHCRVWAQYLWHMGFVALQHFGPSWARDQTHVPCTGKFLTTGPPGMPQIAFLKKYHTVVHMAVSCYVLTNGEHIRVSFLPCLCQYLLSVVFLIIAILTDER